MFIYNRAGGFTSQLCLTVHTKQTVEWAATHSTSCRKTVWGKLPTFPGLIITQGTEHLCGQGWGEDKAKQNKATMPNLTTSMNMSLV